MIDMISLSGGGSGLPIGAQQAISTDGRVIYTDPDGAIWLQVGTVETDLGVYPLAPTTRADVGNNFTDPASNGEDLCWDGTNFWVVSGVSNLVYKLDSAGTDTGFSFSISTASGAEDIIWDGTNLVVTVNTNGGLLRKFNTSGGDAGTIDVSAQLTNPFSTSWDGTYYYVRSNSSNSSTFKYDSVGTFVEEITGVSGVSFKGTDFDGTNFWVQYSSGIFRYSNSWDLSSGIAYPLIGSEKGLCIKDEEFYYIDSNIDKIRILQKVSGQAYGEATLYDLAGGSSNYIKVT